MNTSKRSDIYTRQWDVGSFTDPTKKPYKVSERRDGRWECSCPAWTRHTPRTDCKHIIKVQKAIRFAPESPVFIARPPAACANKTPIIPNQPTRVIFDGYAIRRRALDDTLTDADAVVDATTVATTVASTIATVRRSRREI